LPGTRQEAQEVVRLGSEVTVAVRARQRRGVKQDAAAAFVERIHDG
jgi:hypothetical protein